MVKSIIIAGLLLISSTSFSQLFEASSQEGRMIRRPTGYRQTGLLEAGTTLSPSSMFARKSVNYYLSGFAEYHFNHRVSLRADNFFYLNGLGDSPFVNNAIRSYFGALYHFNQDVYSNWDVYVGFQPGVTAMSKTNYDGIEPLVAIEPSRMVLSPSFAISAGTKFYVWKYFNFFANVSYVNSNLGGVPDGTFNTDEIIFSAGLGFQINTKG